MTGETQRSRSWSAALLTSCRRALQWRLLLLWSLAQALPTLLVCLPLWAALAAQLDRSLLAYRLLHGFEVPVYLEALFSLAKRGGYSAGSGPGAALLFVLTLPWLAGITTVAARAREPLRLGALIHGGLNEYWRMTRLGLWALLPLGSAIAAGSGAVYLAEQYGAKATLESDAQHAMWAAVSLAALLFTFARAGVDSACTRLVLEPERRSVVVAWWRGSIWLLRRPWHVLPYLLLTAAGWIAATLLGWLRIQIPAVGPLGLVAAFVLGQALVLSLAWLRCARLFALVAAASPPMSERSTPTQAQRSVQAEPGEHGRDDDNQTDDVDDTVHDLSRELKLSDE
jgi:hypothetical protein